MNPTSASATSRAGDPVVDVRGLSIDRAGRRLFEPLDLRLAAGERLALTGATGSGKSTLLHALMGFVRPAAGSITLLGRACREEHDFAPLRGPIGLLFQDPGDQLFGPTVLEDVAFGPLNQGLARSAADDAARDMLRRLRLDSLAHRPVHHLSGGEQRLVCLAGVLVMAPRLLLLDEPTTGLDDTTRDRLLATLLATGLPMIVATHDRHCVATLCQREQQLAPVTGQASAPPEATGG